MFKSLPRFILTFAVLSFFSLQAWAQPVQESTASDQTSVEVTVYNHNFGLIKDVRKIQIPDGEGELRFMDVASKIMPVTVRARSLNAPDDFMILEQNYEYDLMNQNKLLDKYVGKKIKLLEINEFWDKSEEKEAELLSNNSGQIYRIEDEIFLGHPGIRILPEIPENLIARPTLTWLFRNEHKKPHELEVSYMTGDIGWKADYVAVLNDDDTGMDLSGWVTLDNRSGAAYPNARLKLIAGDVNVTKQDSLRRRMAKGYQMAAMAEAAPQFEEKAFFEYHIYDLQRQTTIKNNQSKQIRLLEASGISAVKEYLISGNQGYFVRQYRGDNPRQPVNVFLKFKNMGDNNLGMPLPAGVMRLYKKDDDGSLQFVGEDRIQHTPRDEEIKLKVGKAFDVVAERVQKDYQRIANGVHETEWEITVKNRKDEDITVGIVEPLYASWKMLSQSHPHEKKDAFTIRFDVSVPKGQEIKVSYRVRVSTDHRVIL